MLKLHNVTKTYENGTVALKDVSLELPAKGFIAVVGASGSGKSTLLKIIAGIEKEYQGEVVFSPGYSVGYLEQDPKLEPGKTVKEIVQEGVQEIVDTLKEYEEVNEKFGCRVYRLAGTTFAAVCRNSHLYHTRPLLP